MNAAMTRMNAQQMLPAQTLSVRMSASALMDTLEMDSIVQVSSVIECICFKLYCNNRKRLSIAALLFIRNRTIEDIEKFLQKY